MLTVALIFDLLSIIPVVNWVIFILTPLTFGLWFALQGAGMVGVFNTKKAASEVGIYAIEFIPVVSILPGIFVRIYRTIKMIQLEDKEHNKGAQRQNSDPVIGRIGPAQRKKAA